MWHQRLEVMLVKLKAKIECSNRCNDSNEKSQHADGDGDMQFQSQLQRASTLTDFSSETLEFTIKGNESPLNIQYYGNEINV